MQHVQNGYWIALGALIVLMFWGTSPMRRTVGALLLVGVVSLFLAGDPALRLLGLTLPGLGLWPTEPYAIAMIIVDALAAWAILWHPAGKAQSLIGLTF